MIARYRIIGSFHKNLQPTNLIEHYTVCDSNYYVTITENCAPLVAYSHIATNMIIDNKAPVSYRNITLSIIAITY